MVLLDSLFSVAALKTEIEAGYVKVAKHHDLDLEIYNYTRAAQYDSRWNAVTMQCRGLVIEASTRRIIARSLPKFFNLAEHDGTRAYATPIPRESFEITDKLDGSLGIIFYYAEAWRACSKASFYSDQAQWTTDWLAQKAPYLGQLDTALTYSTEVIYPENRIVVDYNTRQDLVLLAAFLSDGTEVSRENIAKHWTNIGSVVPTYGISNDPTDIAKRLSENLTLDGEMNNGTSFEGYVLRFQHGLRVKVKLADYLRLHRLYTGTTARNIWRAVAADYLRTADPSISNTTLARTLRCSVKTIQNIVPNALDDMLEAVPDEFDTYVRRIAAQLSDQFTQTLRTAQELYQNAISLGGDRRLFAETLRQLRVPKNTAGYAFSLLDKKDIAPLIWRNLYPAADAAFKQDE